MMKQYKEIIVVDDVIETPYILTITEDIAYKTFPVDENNEDYKAFLEHIDEYEKVVE